MKRLDALHLLPIILWMSLNKPKNKCDDRLYQYIPSFPDGPVKEWYFLALVPLIFTLHNDSFRHIGIIITLVLLSKAMQTISTDSEQDITFPVALAGTLVAIYGEKWQKVALIYPLIYSIFLIMIRKSRVGDITNDALLVSSLFLIMK